MSSTLQATDSLYLRRASVRKRYDVSDAWIVRKIATDGFPAPIRIGNSRDFWRIADLDAWDAAKITTDRDVYKHKPPVRTKSPGTLADAQRGAVEAGLEVEQRFRR